ncbi:MAG TPA: UPF0280 family protein, partial [Caldimonas sp.]
DDSDLGARLVTCDVPLLSRPVVARALAAGAAVAEAEVAAGRALGAALCLQGRVRTCAGAAAFDTLAYGPQAARIGAALGNAVPRSIRM